MKKIVFLLLMFSAFFTFLSAGDAGMYGPAPSANIPPKPYFFSHRNNDKKLEHIRRANRDKRIRQAATQAATDKSAGHNEKTPGAR